MTVLWQKKQAFTPYSKPPWQEVGFHHSPPICGVVGVVLVYFFIPETTKFDLAEEGQEVVGLLGREGGRERLVMELKALSVPRRPLEGLRTARGVRTGRGAMRRC